MDSQTELVASYIPLIASLSNKDDVTIMEDGLWNEISKFLKSLLGFEFTLENLKDSEINSKVINCLKKIQNDIDEARSILSSSIK